MIVAGILGGLANSMAGGASLFTFPAMLFIGLPPVTANATNSFALLPGNSLGAIADRESFPPRTALFWAAIALAVAGGLCGAILLLATSARVFALLVPALIGAATLIFTFSKQIRLGLSALMEGEAHPTLRLVLLFIAAIYNGYFGAGVGVIFLATLAATGHETLRTTNAFKNALTFMSNIGGVVIYLFSGAISFHHGLIMMIGAGIGGLSGGKLVKVLPPQLVRGIITACGCVMTLVYVYRFWL
nr:sulfite exporter TauE/SafE family protein [Aestuariivirga litoralis]